MTQRRVVDVSIKSELKKGFGDVSKALSQLENSLKQVAGLQESVNKLAAQFERANNFKQAAQNAKQLATNTRQLTQAQKDHNNAIVAGQRVANRYMSEYDKLGRQLQSFRTYQKSSSMDAQKAMNAEIGMLKDYIKKTNDLSVLTQKNLRGSNGRFVAFSPQAIRQVQGEQVGKMFQNFRLTPRYGTGSSSTNLSTQNRINSMLGIGSSPELSPQDKKFLNMYYKGFAEEAEKKFDDMQRHIAARQAVKFSARPGAGLGVQELINRTTGVSKTSDSKFEYLKQNYARLQAKGDAAEANMLQRQYAQIRRIAEESAARIRRLNFGPNPRNSESGFQKLFNNYNKLGHFLFQLQYSTYTLMGLLGVGFIAKQADEYITLRNQVARTSESINDLGANMKDVMKISRETFSDPSATGRLFARIDAYRKDLKLNRQDVVNVTGSIQGAFAASPGNAQEKAAAQYQFIQALQSNRLGGDELRSILEQAPYVADILSKGVAKVRGMKEGSVINLRDQNHPVNAKEIVAVFNDPEVRAEIKRTLGQQARTFGDAMMLGKIKLMELTKSFNDSTGIFTMLIHSLTSFLGNDKAMDNFIKKLELATTALVIFTGATAVKGVSGFVGGQLRALGAYRAASAEVATIRASSKAMGIGGGMIEGMMVANTSEKAAEAFSKLAKPLRAIVPAIGETGIQWGKMLMLFSKSNLLWAAISAVVAALILRFNHLLGKMTGGMNIMDILMGTWDKLGRAMGWVANKIDQLTGGLFSGLGKAIDWVLAKLAKLFAEDQDFQARQADRMYGGNDGKFYIQDPKSKGIYKGRAYKNDKTGRMEYDFYRDSKGNLVSAPKGTVADVVSGQRTREAFTPELPAGQSQSLPPQNTKNKKSEAQKRLDKLNEFIRDSYLQVAESMDNILNPSSMQEIQKTYDDAIKRAADIMDIDAFKRDKDGLIVGIKSMAEIIAELPAKSKALILDAADKLKQAKLDEAIARFERELTSSLGQAKGSAIKAGLSEYEGQQYDIRSEAISRFANDSSYWDMSKVKAAQEDFNNGKIGGMANPQSFVNITNARGFQDQAESTMMRFLTPQGQDSYKDFVGKMTDYNREQAINGAKRSSALAAEQLKHQHELLGLFGKERERRAEILSIEERYTEQYGDRLNKEPDIQAAMKEEIRLAKERQKLEMDYQSNWRNGAKEALAEYLDRAKDVASQTHDLFANALASMEDMITEFLKTGHYDLKGWALQIVDEIRRMFVRNVIMPKIIDYIQKMFHIKLMVPNDVRITANKVVVNGGTDGGTGDGTGTGTGNGTDGGTSTPGSDGKTPTDPTQQTGGWFSKIMSMVKGFFGKFMSFFKNIFSSIGKIFGLGGGGAGGGGGTGIMSTIMSFLGKLGAGAGNVASTAGSWIMKAVQFVAALFHDGGVAGQSGPSRVVPASMFFGARRYHTGGTAGMPALAANEVPAILKQGERILTVPQQKMMGAGGINMNTATFAPTVNVNYTAGAGSDTSEDDAQKMASMVQDNMKAQFDQWLLQQMRPGGIMYGRK